MLEGALVQFILVAYIEKKLQKMMNGHVEDAEGFLSMSLFSTKCCRTSIMLDICSNRPLWGK